MKKFEKLEAIRGFVALYVVMHHILLLVPEARSYLSIFGRNIYEIFAHGRVAVIIFFILSGFVINYSFHYATNKSFKIFFFKRATRIFIPLFALWFITPFIQYYQQGCVQGFSIASFLGNLFMLQDLDGYLNYAFPPLFDNYSLWSLSYEWWYYMLFFLISIKCYKINPHYIVYPIIGFCILTSGTLPYLLIRWGDNFIFWWLGYEIACLHIEGKKINSINLKLPIMVLLLGAGVHYYKHILGIYRELEQARFYIYVVFLIAIGIFWRKQKWFLFDKTLAPFRKLSSISYGIYITHVPLIINATYLDFIDNWYLRYSCYLLICFAFSYFIERIVYPLLTKYLRKKLNINPPIEANKSLSA